MDMVMRRILPLVVWGVGLGCVLSPVAGAQDCLDYSTYLHWLDSFDTPGVATSVAEQGGVLYVADDQAGIQVIDVSDPDNPAIVHTVGSAVGARDLVLNGSHAFVAAGNNGFYVVDISNPNAANVVDTVETAGPANSVFVLNNLLYVAVAESGLQVFDVADATNPQLVRKIPLSGTAYGVTAAGYYAYVASGFAGMQVVDMIEPSLARVVGSVDTPGNAKDLAFDKRHVFIADGDHGVAEISHTSRYFSEADWQFTNSGIDSSGQHHVSLSGGAAYEYDGKEIWGLVTADESSFATYALPLNTIYSGRVSCRIKLSTPFTADPGFAGNIDILTSDRAGVSQGDFRLGLDPFDGQLVFSQDDQDSAVLSEIRSNLNIWEADIWYEITVTWDGLGRTVQVRWSDEIGSYDDIVNDGYAAPCFSRDAETSRIASRQATSPLTELTIDWLEIEDSTPSFRLVSTTPATGYVQDLTILDSYAFLAIQNGDLEVVDFTTPGWPRLAGTVDTPNDGQGVCVAGDFIYVADGGNGIHVISRKTSVSPPALATWDTPGSPYGLVVSGGLALIADRDAGLQVVDVAAPSAPQLLVQVPTAGNAIDVAVSGNLAVVAEAIFYGAMNKDLGRGKSGFADSEALINALFPKADQEDLLKVASPYSGIQIVDISNPAASTVVGTLETPGFALDVEIAGQTAYVADFSGFLVVDITQPDTPEIVGAINSLGQPRDLAVKGNLVFVADLDGMQVIDVSIPTSPMLLGSLSTPGPAYGVAVSGSFAYVADVEAGLHVVDITNPAIPAIVGSLDMPGGAYDVEVMGEFAYVSDGFDPEYSALQVVDVSVPAAPHITGHLNTPGSVYAVALEGDYLFVTDGARGLQVLGSECSPGVQAAPDLSVQESSIRFTAPEGSVEIVEGMNITVGVVVANKGGQSATGRVVCEFEDISGNRQPLGEAWVSLNRQGNSASEVIVEIPWQVQLANTVIHVSLQDVEPADSNITDNSATKELSDHSLLAYAAEFLVSQDSKGFAIEWNSAPFSASVGFRLVGASGDNEWEIPYHTDGGGLVGAIDQPLDEYTGAEVTYSLYIHDLEFGWVLLASKSVRNDPPRILMRLIGAVPNPFNPQATVRFAVDRPQHIKIVILDIAGRQIRVLTDQMYNPGNHSVGWQGRDSNGQGVASGLYFARMQGTGFTAVSKLTLVR